MTSTASVPKFLSFGPRPVSVFTQDQDADTYGWDTAFAIDFAHANTAIVKGWNDVNKGAKTVSQSADDDPSYKIDGELGAWQLTNGGDGKNVKMRCPFISGTYQAGAHSYPLKGVDVVIEVGMEWVPNPDQFAFVIDNNDVVKGIVDVLDTNRISDALKAAFQKAGKPLGSGAAALVQKAGLEWQITDGANNFYIFRTHDAESDAFLNVYQWEKAWANNLKLLTQEVSKEQPPVAIITIVNDPATGVAAAVLRELLDKWFNTHISEFNHVFSALNLSPSVSKDDKWAWMKPTATSYAVTDGGTLDSSVFGVLTMVQNHEPGTNHQVSPYAIPLSKGANAGFLVSGPMFLRNIMLAGARAIFNDADESSFEVINDGLTVQNTKDLVWGKFMMDEKKRASVGKSTFVGELDQKKLPVALIGKLNEDYAVDVAGYAVTPTAPGSQWLLSKTGSRDEYILNLNGENIDVYLATIVTIEKGRFKVSLIHTYVEIEFTNLKYSYSSDFDVHIDYKEQVTLSLQEKGGKKLFWFDQIQKNMVINVTKTQAAITREIVEAAVAAAVALIAIGASVIAGLRAGAEIAEVTDEAGDAIIDEEVFEEVAEENPAEEAANEEDALVNAAAQTEGRFTRIVNAFNTPKWKFFTALVAAVAGGDALYQTIMEAVLKNQWEKVPAFDTFADVAVAPYTWPGAKGYTLTSSGLAGSLQIGLKVDAQ